MFVDAIERASRFTRPIHTISRWYGSNDVYPGAATLFFVNRDGWALTCRHVAEQLLAAEEIAKRRTNYEGELASFSDSRKQRRAQRDLLKKYGFQDGIPFELLNLFFNCVEGDLQVEFFLHPEHDVALLRFHHFSRLLCNTFPVFLDNGEWLKPGKFLCRIGFPFVEFTNYCHDDNSDRIKWTDEGRKDSPWFPLEGMMTRLVSDDGVCHVGFELSTPGIRGQSGGPVFDSTGRICGMQFATQHYDLDFDVNLEVTRGGKKKTISNSAILHVGRCIHVNVLKEFMRENGVEFEVG